MGKVRELLGINREYLRTTMIQQYSGQKRVNKLGDKQISISKANIYILVSVPFQITLTSPCEMISGISQEQKNSQEFSRFLENSLNFFLITICNFIQ